MIPISDLADWLHTFDGLADAVINPKPGAVDAQYSGAIITVLFTGGPGEKAERAVDVLALDVHVRGDKNNLPSSAATLMDAVDDGMLKLTPPFTIGSTRIVDAVSRTGGPPTWHSRDSTDRDLYLCSYLLTVARTVF